MSQLDTSGSAGAVQIPRGYKYLSTPGEKLTEGQKFRDLAKRNEESWYFKVTPTATVKALKITGAKGLWSEVKHKTFQDGKSKAKHDSFNDIFVFDPRYRIAGSPEDVLAAISMTEGRPASLDRIKFFTRDSQKEGGPFHQEYLDEYEGYSVGHPKKSRQTRPDFYKVIPTLLSIGALFEYDKKHLSADEKKEKAKALKKAKAGVKPATVRAPRTSSKGDIKTRYESMIADMRKAGETWVMNVSNFDSKLQTGATIDKKNPAKTMPVRLAEQKFTSVFPVGDTPIVAHEDEAGSDYYESRLRDALTAIFPGSDVNGAIATWKAVIAAKKAKMAK